MSVLRVHPSDEDAILPVTVGTIVWLIVLVVLVIRRSQLEAADATWWIGAAAVGLVSGPGGLVFLYWRRSRMGVRAA